MDGGRRPYKDSWPMRVASMMYSMMAFCIITALVAFPVLSSYPVHAARPEGSVRPEENIARLPFDAVTPQLGSFALSADGRIGAHIREDDEVVVWNAISTKQLESIKAGDNKPTVVSLSANGDLIAIGYANSKVVVRSRLEHKVLHQLSGHFGAISALAFSPNGQMLASGARDATTQLWDLSTGKRLHVFDSLGGDDGGYIGLPVGIWFSGDNKALLVNEWQPSQYDISRWLTYWDIDDGTDVKGASVGTPDMVVDETPGVALGGKNWLVAYPSEGGLAIQRLDQCVPAQRLPFGADAVAVVADPLGRWIAVAERPWRSADDAYFPRARNYKLTFVTTNDGKMSHDVKLFARSLAFAVSPDGRFVYAHVIRGAGPNLESSPSGNENVDGDEEGALYRITVPDRFVRQPQIKIDENAKYCRPPKPPQQDFKIPDRPIVLNVVPSRSLSDDANHPDLSLDKDTRETFRLENRHIERFSANGKRLRDVTTKGKALAVAARNGRLAAVLEKGRVYVWQLQPKGETKIYNLPVSIYEGYEYGIDELALSGDGRYLQVAVPGQGDADTSYETIRLNSGEIVAHDMLLAPFPKSANRGVVPDVRRHHLAVWDYDKGEIIARLPRHRSRNKEGAYMPLQAAISDDGRLVASASYDGLVRVWDINARQMLGEGLFGGAVAHMSFDSAGRRLEVDGGGRLVTFEIPDPHD